MFQTSVLFSGSRGNSILVRTKSTSILFDVGVSGKKIISQLKELSLQIDEIKAIVVSHEHTDHIKGVGVLLRKLKIPLYISAKTYENSKKIIGNIPLEPIFFDVGQSFFVGDIKVQTFPSSHDAVDSCCFTVKTAKKSGRKLAIITDTGYISKILLQYLKKTTCLIIESNHDEQLLFQGNYPWNVKQRIKSKHGHLSNSEAVAVIERISTETNIKNIVLTHLSEENNNIKIAQKRVKKLIKLLNMNLNLFVANQKKSTQLINV